MSQSQQQQQQQQSKPEIPLVHTESTRVQKETEEECAPFFVDLDQLSTGQREHLSQIGLVGKDASSMQSSVQLLREKHAHYLSQVWNAPLKAPFVSLDSSRPWILYWCLHGVDLLNGNGGTCTSTITNQQGINMIETLQDCWQHYHTKDPPTIVVSNAKQDPFYFLQHDEDTPASDTSPSPKYYCGGFGGGPGQLAHAATTYAAVLSLCILATDSVELSDDDDSTSAEEHYSTLAREMLYTIRTPLYRWFASLQCPESGAYRMHHDGEVDVRATYTIVACAKLLGLLSGDGVLKRNQVIDFVVSCQTYEGGMGGEPFTEAHGGYTFCGVAALQIMGALHSNENANDNSQHSSIDVPALQGWLARRQMAFEGGFSGRSNKLVDGCYSLWQGGATAIASSCSSIAESSSQQSDDPWLKSYYSSIKTGDSSNASAAGATVSIDNLPFPLLFDVSMLERYILLCAQEVQGGLRDKPSKPRDFYHTCYNLSGLSVAQHCANNGTDKSYGDPAQTRLAATHPCYNIRIDRVASMLKFNWNE